MCYFFFKKRSLNSLRGFIEILGWLIGWLNTKTNSEKNILLDSCWGRNKRYLACDLNHWAFTYLCKFYTILLEFIVHCRQQVVLGFGSLILNWQIVYTYEFEGKVALPCTKRNFSTDPTPLSSPPQVSYCSPYIFYFPSNITTTTTTT